MSNQSITCCRDGSLEDGVCTNCGRDLYQNPITIDVSSRFDADTLDTLCPS